MGTGTGQSGGITLVVDGIRQGSDAGSPSLHRRSQAAISGIQKCVATKAQQSANAIEITNRPRAARVVPTAGKKYTIQELCNMCGLKYIDGRVE